MFPPKTMPKMLESKREREIKKYSTQTTNPENSSTLVDFGAVDDDGQYEIEKIRVRVCGRPIHKYPS
jgi:hypothetical protein